MEFLIDRKITAIEYAEKMLEQVNKITTPEEKKVKGQFFTSASIATYMASLSLLDKNELRILDPGAGTGILIAALVDRIISEGLDVSLEGDAIENDSLVLPSLQQMMDYCNAIMKKHGNNFKYQILNDDFILSHSFLFQDDLSNFPKEVGGYDLFISNPPYFKVNTNHEYSQVLAEYVHGQPNVYFMFMVVAEKLLKVNGQLVFITPRSCCSGAYFERFREKFFEEIDTDHIHIFTSRKGNFEGESVLQENIILSGFKRTIKNQFLIISSSMTGNISDNHVQDAVPKSLIFDSTDQINLIRLPIDKFESDILAVFDGWSNNLTVMNMNISTGSVVNFRNKEYISQYEEGKIIPCFI